VISRSSDSRTASSCVNVRPRADISRIGPVGASASTASKNGSGFMTMPAPPPNG
jgi:hypothetical protein